MSDENSQPKSDTPRKGNPERRMAALVLLGAGYTYTRVAEELGVDRRTVRKWRDDPEGKKFLDGMIDERIKTIQDEILKSLKLIAANLTRITNILIDQLDAFDEKVVVSSARELWNILVNATKNVAADQGNTGFDLANLSEEEFSEYERLNKKARERV